MINSAKLPRLLFTHTLSNGIACATGVMLIALAGYALGGQALAALLLSGALSVSIADMPVPRGYKLIQLLPALIGTTLVTLLVSASHHAPLLLGIEVLLVGFAAGLLSAWGRLLLPLGFSMILSMVFAMAFPAPADSTALAHSAVFALGGFIYTLWGVALARLSETRTRQQVVADALDGFADYLRRKAAFYNPDRSLDAVHNALINGHAALAEKLQAARDFCFHGIRAGQREQIAKVLYALLDAYEHALAAQTDRALLRARYGQQDAMRAIGERVNETADDIATVANAMLRARPIPALPDRAQSCAATHAAINALVQADATSPDHAASAEILRGAAARLFVALASARAVLAAADTRGAEALPGEEELKPFLTARQISLGTLRPHLQLKSPVVRYAIRLSLAMLTGFALGRSMPYAAHGHWILLTTAVVLRPSFSQTRQRHNDRVIGNLIGCVIAGLMLHFVQMPAGILPLLFVAIAVAHAFVTVQYRVTSIAACVMGLLQLHLLAPSEGFVLTERIIDTVIGALLALAFSFLLPSWEQLGLPQALARLREAAARYASAALDPAMAPLAYRLARKQMQDALANLTQAIARMRDEPQSRQLALPPLHGAVAAGYLLATQLASIRMFMDRRSAELAVSQRDALLAIARRELATALSTEAAEATAPNAPDIAADASNALQVLQKRLAAARDDALRLASLTRPA